MTRALQLWWWHKMAQLRVVFGRDSLGRDPDRHFALFRQDRDDRRDWIGADQRFLTPDDFIQEGDGYFVSETEWCEFGDSLIGKKIALDCFCYTPAGIRVRGK